MPICFECGSGLVWSSDFNGDEIYTDNECYKDAIVSFYTCPNCSAEYQVTTGLKNEEY